MESLCAVKLKRSDKAFINAYADLLTNGCSDKIYVSDICKQAGYTTMCFYQNYEDKNAFGKFIVDYETDLYIECIKRMNDLILCGEATPENFMVSGCEFFSRVYEKRNIFSCIFNDLLINSTERYIAKRVADAIGEYIHYEEENPVKNEYLHWFLMRRYMTAYRLAERWWKNGFDCKPEEISEIYYEICMLLDSGVNLSKTILL